MCRVGLALGGPAIESIERIRPNMTFETNRYRFGPVTNASELTSKQQRDSSHDLARMVQQLGKA